MNKALFLLTLASILGLSGCNFGPKLEVTTNQDIGQSLLGNFVQFETMTISSKDERKLNISEIIANNEYVATDEEHYFVTIDLDSFENADKLRARQKEFIQIHKIIDSLKRSREYISIDSSNDRSAEDPYQNTYLSPELAKTCDSLRQVAYQLEQEQSNGFMTFSFTCPLEKKHQTYNKLYTIRKATTFTISMGEERKFIASNFCKKENTKSCEKMDAKFVKIYIQTNNGVFSGEFIPAGN